jgi:hypothetical protein
MPVTFTVNAVPTNLSYYGNLLYCKGQTVMIVPSVSNINNITYQWSLTSNFAPTSILGTNYVDLNGNLTYTANNVGSTTYYLRAINSVSGCTSTVLPITVTVNIQPTNISVNKLTNQNSTTYCQNGTTEQYLATGVNVTKFRWYNDSLLTQEILATYTTGTNNNTLNVNPSLWTEGTHNVYVIGENSNGCHTDPININFTIVQGVTNVSSDINNFTICQTESKLINLDNPNNFTVTWYTNSAGTQTLNSNYITNNGNTVNINGLNFSLGNNSIYYRVQNSAGCISTLMPISFNVLPAPINLTVTNNNSNVCQGNYAEFEAAGQNITSYQWYKDYASGLVADPSYVSGTGNYKLKVPTGSLSPGIYNYYVVGVNSNGCQTEPIKVTFNVKLLPGNTTIIGENTYCQNQNIHFKLLNATTSTFKWFNDINGLNPLDSKYISNDGATINILASTYNAGTYKLYYYATNLDCKTSMQTVSFTINESPSNLNVTGNKSAYCFEEQIDIAVGSSTGVTKYNWYTDSNASVLVDPLYLSGTMNERFKSKNLIPGTYNLYVKAINTSGCESSIKNISFIVNSTPTIDEFKTNSSTIQEGKPIIFNITASGYSKWRLLFNGSQIEPSNDYNTGTITNYQLTTTATPTNQGKYTLEITNGTCITSKEFYLYILPKVTITHNRLDKIAVDNGKTKVILTQHDSIAFTVNIDEDTYSKEWFYGDGFDNSTIVGNHYYNINGEFTVTLKLTNKITGDKFNVDYELPILVKQIDPTIPITTLDPPNTNYTIYPNPYKEYLGIKYNANAGEKMIIRIYDIRGISVFNANWYATGGTTNNKIFYNPLLIAPSGTYLVVIYNETTKSEFNAKLIKQ